MNKLIKCRTIDGGIKEVSVDELSFRPSAYAVIIQNGKILLVPQFDGYDFPGGGVDLGELMGDALVREVKEETGMEVKAGQVLLAEDAFFFHPFKKKAFQTPLIYFLCEVTGGEISDGGFDEHEKEYAKKAEWIPLEKALSLKFCTPIDGPKLIKDALRLQEQLRLSNKVQIQ